MLKNISRHCSFVILLFCLVGCVDGRNPAQNNEISDPNGDDAMTIPTEMPQEYVLTNGAIYTVNRNQPWAEALAVRNGEIVAVGTEEDVLHDVADGVLIINLNGRMVMPGFQDPHLHVLEAGVK